MTIADIKKNAQERMTKSIETLRADLAKVRTGRAHTGILDHIQVDYYGSPTALTRIALARVWGYGGDAALQIDHRRKRSF